jgi:hypothetical protein
VGAAGAGEVAVVEGRIIGVALALATTVAVGCMGVAVGAGLIDGTQARGKIVKIKKRIMTTWKDRVAFSTFSYFGPLLQKAIHSSRYITYG